MEKIWNKNFILLFITNLLMMTSFYAIVPIIPIYCLQVGITGSKIGIILTAMCVTTVLFRPAAGYILDNFNRYRVYVLFLALFSLPFFGFAAFAAFWVLVMLRLIMGMVYSVCGSATVTLAGDVLPDSKVCLGINRFTLTFSLGMALGPLVGIRVQQYLSSKASFLLLFTLVIVAVICVSCCKIEYPKVKRKKYLWADAFYKPALPFMLNMMFFTIPFGAVIAYSSMLAQEKGFMAVVPYFYICLVGGMLLAKFSTQKMIDAGTHSVLVIVCILILFFTMGSYFCLSTELHFLIAGILFGIGYGILQPLFQSFVTATAPTHKRGCANTTYLLSYDIGIGIGSLLMGFFQDSIGLSRGFAITASAFPLGGAFYALYVDKYYWKLVIHGIAGEKSNRCDRGFLKCRRLGIWVEERRFPNIFTGKTIRFGRRVQKVSGDE